MDSFLQYKNIKIDEVCRICLIKKDEMALIYENGVSDIILECFSLEVKFIIKQINNIKLISLRTGFTGKWFIEFNM